MLVSTQDERGMLRNVSQDVGPIFQRSFAARGLAVGDFNNDGAIDAIIGINGAPPVLLKTMLRKEITGWA